jgi:hypothetical protein
MKHILLSLTACLSILLSSCASRSTPFGMDRTLGTDTHGYVGASGGASITLPDGRTIRAEKLLIVDKELNSPSFHDAVGLGATAVRWYIGGNVVKALGNNWSGVAKSKEVTTRTGITSSAATKQAKIAADAAAKQAQIAADAEAAAAGTP